MNAASRFALRAYLVAVAIFAAGLTATAGAQLFSSGRSGKSASGPTVTCATAGALLYWDGTAVVCDAAITRSGAGTLSATDVAAANTVNAYAVSAGDSVVSNGYMSFNSILTGGNIIVNNANVGGGLDVTGGSINFSSSSDTVFSGSGDVHFNNINQAYFDNGLYVTSGGADFGGAASVAGTATHLSGARLTPIQGVALLACDSGSEGLATYRQKGTTPAQRSGLCVCAAGAVSGTYAYKAVVLTGAFTAADCT